MNFIIDLEKILTLVFALCRCLVIKQNKLRSKISLSNTTYQATTGSTSSEVKVLFLCFSFLLQEVDDRCDVHGNTTKW